MSFRHSICPHHRDRRRLHTCWPIRNRILSRSPYWIHTLFLQEAMHSPNKIPPVRRSDSWHSSRPKQHLPGSVDCIYNLQQYHLQLHCYRSSHRHHWYRERMFPAHIHLYRRSSSHTPWFPAYVLRFHARRNNMKYRIYRSPVR